MSSPHPAVAPRPGPSRGSRDRAQDRVDELWGARSSGWLRKIAPASAPWHARERWLHELSAVLKRWPRRHPALGASGDAVATRHNADSTSRSARPAGRRTAPRSATSICSPPPRRATVRRGLRGGGRRLCSPRRGRRRRPGHDARAQPAAGSARCRRLGGSRRPRGRRGGNARHERPGPEQTARVRLAGFLDGATFLGGPTRQLP
jgi:hypothetical protein